MATDAVMEMLNAIVAGQTALGRRMDQIESGGGAPSAGLEGVIQNEKLRKISHESDLLAGTSQDQPYGPLGSQPRQLRTIGVRLDRWTAEMKRAAEALEEIPEDIRSKAVALQKVQSL